MFIEKRHSNSLQSRRDDICILDTQDKHIVPTGLKNGWSILFYKHIVPTGLKRGHSQSQYILLIVKNTSAKTEAIFIHVNGQYHRSVVDQHYILIQLKYSKMAKVLVLNLYFLYLKTVVRLRCARLLDLQMSKFSIITL